MSYSGSYFVKALRRSRLFGYFFTICSAILLFVSEITKSNLIINEPFRKIFSSLTGHVPNDNDFYTLTIFVVGGIFFVAISTVALKVAPNK